MFHTWYSSTSFRTFILTSQTAKLSHRRFLYCYNNLVSVFFKCFVLSKKHNSQSEMLTFIAALFCLEFYSQQKKEVLDWQKCPIYISVLESLKMTKFGFNRQFLVHKICPSQSVSLISITGVWCGFGIRVIMKWSSDGDLLCVTSY